MCCYTSQTFMSKLHGVYNVINTFPLLYGVTKDFNMPCVCNIVFHCGITFHQDFYVKCCVIILKCD